MGNLLIQSRIFIKKLFFISFLIFINLYGYSQNDTIFLKSGVNLNCKIDREDSSRIYFNFLNHGINVNSFVDKSDIIKVKYKTKEIIQPITSSYLNLGIGYGPSYGILGTKLILGTDNSGFTFGIGYTPHGLLAASFGLQGSIRWFFINFGIGSIGEYRFDNDSYKLAYGIYYDIGGLINLEKSKRWYLEVGLGNAFKFNIDKPEFYSSYKDFNYYGSIGIGYRFGN